MSPIRLGRPEPVDNSPAAADHGGDRFRVRGRHPAARAPRPDRHRSPPRTAGSATPAFIAVGTKATVKAVLPESMAALGAQAVLANAYHLYLQPGADIVDGAGGLGRFMNWPGPTFTDSGGFQVMSLGVGFKKVLAMDTAGLENDDVIAAGRSRLATVDDDGVTFTSHLDGIAAPVHPRGLDADPAPAGRRHHVRLRRADHADEHPRLPGAVGGADPCLGSPLPGRAPPAHRGAPAPAVPGAVRSRPGRAVRGPPSPQPAAWPSSTRRPGLRRVRHRRCAGEGQSSARSPAG